MRSKDSGTPPQQPASSVPGLKGRYVDPVVFPERNWRDLYHYTADGQLLGWDRISGGSVRHFTRHGALVVETDAQGRPVKAEQIRYDIRNTKQGTRRIVEKPTGDFIHYSYHSTSDVLGQPQF